MTTRTPYVQSEAIGDVLTKANFDKQPSGEVAYTTSTVDSTAANGTVTILTATITAGTSRRYLLTAQCASATASGSGATVSISMGIAAAGTQIANRVLLPTTSTGGQPVPVPGQQLVTYHEPSAGTIAYTMIAITTGAGFLGVINAGATSPMSLLVEDVGPAF